MRVVRANPRRAGRELNVDATLRLSTRGSLRRAQTQMGFASRAGVQCRTLCNKGGHRLQNSKLRAIATDAQFWIPVVVLVLGTCLLLVLK